MTTNTNNCPFCYNVARDTFIEGRAEVLLDDGDAQDWDDAIAQAKRDMTDEDLDEMLEDSTCEDFHA